MKIQIPKQFQFLFKPRRYKVMYSGRGAAKSWSIAQALMILGLQNKLRILCTRELQVSIGDSVHKLLSDMNERYNLGYEVTQTKIRHPVNGTEFLFYGLKTNITKIKSLEGIDIVWLEEAENISQMSLDILIPTIRKENSEIWVSFNPFDENDAVYKQFVTPYINELTINNKYIDNTRYILRTIYSENPFLPDTLTKEINDCKALDYRKYQQVWCGHPIADHENSIIKPEWFDTAIDAHLTLNFKPKGAKVIGFDPADEGSDSKASVNRYGTVVQKINVWADGNLEEAVEKVYNGAVLSKTQEIVYDCVGIGAGAKIKFRSFDPNKTIQVTGFSGGASPTSGHYKDDVLNKDMFRNLRAQYYWYLADRFELTYRAIKFGEYCDPQEMISICSDCEYLDELKSELTKIQRKRSNTNTMIQIESKIDMKKRGLKSPNIADALVYCFADTGVSNKELEPLNFASAW